MSNTFKINYKEYPEFMFAMIAAYLPRDEGNELRKISGSLVFRSEDEKGNTYKNGLLHSYADMPAINEANFKAWYKDGVVHREDDKPAVIEFGWHDWYFNGKRHREGGKPAVVGTDYKGWYIHGIFQTQTINDVFVPRDGPYMTD